MKIVGLTGSIGMGKSTAAWMMARLGCLVFDADATVHRLMAPGGAAVAHILAAFPNVGAACGGIDRTRLGRAVFGQPQALRRLESILHPLVRQAERKFLADAARRRVASVVLDIPLLYETKGEGRCDGVMVVSAPGFLQAARVLKRPGMTMDRLAKIRAQQMPDSEKRRRTRHIVPTGLGKRFALRHCRHCLSTIKAGPSRAYGPHKMRRSWRTR